MRNKISIIGAGNVGATCAQRIIERGYADVVLVSTTEGRPQGKALDILESAPILNFDSHITGTNSYEETANSDVVIIAAGFGGKAGMVSRHDVLLPNMKVVAEVTSSVVNYSPNCIIIVATNPVDAMTYLAIKTSKFSRNRAFGLSSAVDSARFSSFIATELNVSVKNVSACVLGEHGKTMVAIPRLSTVNGVPITEILPPETIDRLVEHTLRGGGEILSLLKTNAFYLASAAIADMVGAILLDKKKIIPCATYLRGEYGITDTVTGVPVKLGRDGIEQIIELDLTTEEKAALNDSARSIQQLVKNMRLGLR